MPAKDDLIQTISSYHQDAFGYPLSKLSRRMMKGQTVEQLQELLAKIKFKVSVHEGR